MVKLNGKQIKITKIKDTRFDGLHPNGIVENYVKIGKAFNDLHIGNNLCINGSFFTSEIIGIDETNCTFTTLNSIYKYEILDEK